MKAKKRMLIITTAIVAVVALTLGVAYAAWDNSKSKDEYLVVTGSNADMTVTYNANTDGQVLVPKNQIGLGVSGTKKTAVKNLGTIDIALNNDAETSDLVVVYDVTKIYSVPKDYAGTKTVTEIAKLDANALATAGIIDLKTQVDGNNRYVTGDETLTNPAPKGTDLRINFVKNNVNYSADEEIAFDIDTTNNTATINGIAVSIEFTRTASEDFETMADFKDMEIVFEITVTLKTKTPTPVAP